MDATRDDVECPGCHAELLVLRPTYEWCRFRCPFDGTVTHIWWTCTDAVDRGRWALVLAGVADPALVAEAVSRN